LTAMRQRRPHVTLKAAATLDGKLADVHGASKWITGEAARQHAHRLRAESDAIIVGVTTALRDDPALTVRLPEPWSREPYRVVLDTRARLSPGARVIHAGIPSRAIIAVGEQAPAARVAALEAAGASVLRCVTREERVAPIASRCSWRRYCSAVATPPASSVAPAAISRPRCAWAPSRPRRSATICGSKPTCCAIPSRASDVHRD